MRRRSSRFFVLVVLILAALPVGWYVFLSEPAAAPPPPPVVVVEAPAPVVLKLAELEGVVEVRSNDGTWRPVDPGEVLVSADAVRTSEGASALLVGGDAWDVRLSSGT